MDFYEKGNNDKKNILFVIHDNWRGGTQLHVQNLVEGLDINYNIFVLSKEENTLLISRDNNVEFMFELNDKYDHTVYTTKEYKLIIRTILMELNISLIHVHHVLGHTLDVFYEAFRLNIPVVITLHDFYYLCPTINLLDVNLEYCKGVHNHQKCLKCSIEKLGYNHDIIDEWRTEIRKLLAGAAQLFAPSHSTKEIYCEYYNEIRSKVLVFEHGTIYRKLGYNSQSDIQYLNIAFVGQISPHKGSNLIYDLVTNNEDTGIKWHLFGGIGDNKFRQLSRSNLVMYGAYDSGEITKLLQENNIHLVCILSIWPETYCYTLTESLLAGIPVLATDIGALGERVRANQVGWLVNYDSTAEDILAKIKEIKNDVIKYDKVVEQIASCEFKTASDMCSGYYNIYESLLRSQRIIEGIEYFDSKMISLASKNADYYRITQGTSLCEIIDELAAYEDFCSSDVGIYIFGTGLGGQLLAQHIKESESYYHNIKGFFDNNSSVWGTEFMNLPVTAPSIDILQKWDIIFIASHTYKDIIKHNLLKMGVPKNRIVYPGILLNNLLMIM